MTTGSSSASKRRRQNNEAEQCLHCAKTKKKHLYLALDERKGEYLGFSIHKLDADNMESEDDDDLPEPAVRFAAPERAPMEFTAVGTSSIMVATSPHASGTQAPPTLVYDTETGALTIGPRLPDGYLRGDSGGAPTVIGEKLYVLTTDVYDDDDDELRRRQQRSFSLRVLLRTPTGSSWFASDTIMAWSWDDDGTPTPLRPPPPSMGRHDLVTSYALHPDGRTIFMSTAPGFTWSLDTGSGAWKELGPWSLPFTGQAYFDGDLDAWVGLRHSDEDGYDVCCCRPVPSRSVSLHGNTTPQEIVECKLLKEKLFLRDGDGGRHLKATLTYMGDSRFCLVETVLNSRYSVDAMLNVTLFGLRYGHNGELCTKARRTTRSYKVSKINRVFSHAVFWM